jgi:benzoyl-CoA reductase/2-hydroxyglutaryl-CoA dehydratase subunit BcrC/BadD/HgdB
LPRPDLIVCCNNICQTILNWYRILAEHTKAPFCLIDTPFLYSDPEPHQVEFVQRQLEDLVGVAEKVAGRTLSWKRMRRVIELSRDTCELYLAILDRAKNHPAPVGAFDSFINMGPVVTLRGEPAAVDFYRDLLAEVDDRIARGIGIVRQERKRVLWDNLPVWHRISWLSRTLAERGVAVVVSNYAYAWGELTPMLNPDKPMESTALVYLSVLLNRSARDKLERMQAMVRDFDVDGVILHSDRSCKPYSFGQVDQRARLVTGLELPALLLEADHNDGRVFSEEQVATRLAAFVETMG